MVKTAWRLTFQRAKIAGLHFHDLRREAGSRWMDAGIPLQSGEYLRPLMSQPAPRPRGVR